MTSTDAADKAGLKAIADIIPNRSQAKSFVPSDHRGIHELIHELEENQSAGDALLQIIKRRLAEFDGLQSRFYNGTKP